MPFKNPADRRAYERRRYAKKHPGLNLYHNGKSKVIYPHYGSRYAFLRALKVVDLTEDQFLSTFGRQTSCQICGDEGKLVFDHNPTTRKPRGMLCSPCNLAIGLVKHSPSRIRAAANYLEECHGC
jgi:hypothetical protein